MISGYLPYQQPQEDFNSLMQKYQMMKMLQGMRGNPNIATPEHPVTRGFTQPGTPAPQPIIPPINQGFNQPDLSTPAGGLVDTSNSPQLSFWDRLKIYAMAGA